MARYSGRGVHGQVVAVLGERIVGGELPEGSRLDLDALGAELDVSLTVLREAMKVLAAKGLLSARQKLGTYVTQRRSWNLLDADVIRWQLDSGSGHRILRDLAEVRSIVEPAAAHRAALHRTEADLHALDEALEAMAAAHAEAPERAAEADADFHRSLFGATGNEILGRMDLLLEPGLRARDHLVRTTHLEDDPSPSHRAVFEAIRDGDPERARTAMVALLETADADVGQAITASAGHAEGLTP